MRLVFMSILLAILTIPGAAHADSSRCVTTLAADLHGNLFLTRDTKILRISPDGSETPVGSTSAPIRALALGRRGEIYVLDSQGMVFQFAEDGTHTILARGHVEATAIAVDRDGTVLITGEKGIVVPLCR